MKYDEILTGRVHCPFQVFDMRQTNNTTYCRTVCRVSISTVRDRDLSKRNKILQQSQTHQDKNSDF